MKHESYTGIIMKNMDFKPKKNINKKEMSNCIHSALNEISFGISGSSLTAYNQACAVAAEDEKWQESGTLQEMQTVVLLADLLKSVLDAQAALELEMALENEQKNE